MKKFKKICLYSSVSDINLFERIGFYRDDIKSLELISENVIATNSIMKIIKLQPESIVSYFYSKSLLICIIGSMLNRKVLLTGGADQISPTLVCGFKLFRSKVIAFFCLLLCTKILLPCKDDLVNFYSLCFGFNFLKQKISYAPHAVVVPEGFIGATNSLENTFVAFTIVWMGSIGNVQRKGVDRSVRLIALMRSFGINALLNIAGTPGPGQHYLEKIARDYGVYENINFLGAIPEAEKFDIYHKVDAYLQLSTREGFGVAAAEALLCGVPVIHSNRGGLSDVIGDKGIILELDSLEYFDKNDISLLLNKVCQFHLNSDILKNLRSKYSIESRSSFFLRELDV